MHMSSMAFGCVAYVHTGYFISDMFEYSMMDPSLNPTTTLPDFESNAVGVCMVFHSDSTEHVLCVIALNSSFAKAVPTILVRVAVDKE